MNYIELINLFWQTRRTVRLSSGEADLYYYLMQECNVRNWENPFACSNGIICATIGITEKTLIDARNRLQQKGLITFSAGQRRRMSPVYTLLYHKKESITGSIQGSKRESKTESITPNLLINKTETKTKRKEIKEKATGFTPPSVEEVKNYCSKRNSNIDAQRFTDFYTAKGWMIGSNKMKDWRAAVRSWERTEKALHPAADHKPLKTPGDERF